MLNGRESIYGFVGWLTGRTSKVEIGSNCNCGGLPDLIEEFANTNHLPPISYDWPAGLIHPSANFTPVDVPVEVDIGTADFTPEEADVPLTSVPMPVPLPVDVNKPSYVVYKPKRTVVAPEHFEMASRAWMNDKASGITMNTGLCESFAEILAVECAGRKKLVEENLDLRSRIYAIARMADVHSIAKVH